MHIHYWFLNKLEKVKLRLLRLYKSWNSLWLWDWDFLCWGIYAGITGMLDWHKIINQGRSEASLLDLFVTYFTLRINDKSNGNWYPGWKSETSFFELRFFIHRLYSHTSKRETSLANCFVFFPSFYNTCSILPLFLCFSSISANVN